MIELSKGWKLFRAGTILQMIFVILEFILSILRISIQKNIFWGILPLVCYFLIFCFLYFGLNLLNNNYPDQLLSIKQKTWFNRLFLLNFLCIAMVFSQFVSSWRNVLPLLFEIDADWDGLNILLVSIFLFYSLFLFAFHIAFLIGMYRLRILLFKNSESEWIERFGKE